MHACESCSTRARLRRSGTFSFSTRVSTAFEMGWSDRSNGNLLALAESQFDLSVTTDQSLQYQQRLAGRRIAILVLTTTSWPRLKAHVPIIVRAIDALQSGEFAVLDMPP